eukprot:scaffold143_cov364-Pavlova_lutheri.AAC.23
MPVDEAVIRSPPIALGAPTKISEVKQASTPKPMHNPTPAAGRKSIPRETDVHAEPSMLTAFDGSPLVTVTDSR